jgi:hypothetical protein
MLIANNVTVNLGDMHLDALRKMKVVQEVSRAPERLASQVERINHAVAK